MLASWSSRVTTISSPAFSVRASEREMCSVRRGHVVAEHDLVRRGGVQEIRHGGVRLLQHRVRLLAGAEGAFVVGVAVQQVAVDAVEALLGDLCPARVVEEHVRGGSARGTAGG